MATTPSKSPGKTLGQSKDYWINAAKQFIWPIDFEHKHILVPEKDLDLAGNNLMVCHFRSHGWHIQSAIVEYTKPFVAPVSTHPIFKEIVKPNSEIKEPDFKCNQEFIIKSTETKMKITGIDKKSIVISYVDSDKQPITTTPENLLKSIRMGVWLKI